MGRCRSTSRFFGKTQSTFAFAQVPYASLFFVGQNPIDENAVSEKTEQINIPYMIYFDLETAILDIKYTVFGIIEF